MPAVFVWLTPPDPAAIAVARVPALPALLDRALPAPGQARFARLLARDGSVVDEVVAARDGDRLDLMCHGGPGLRQAVAAALAGHGLAEAAAPPVDGGERRWRALAGAPSPAAVRWLLTHADQAEPPFAADFLRRLPVVLIAGPANAGKSTLLNAWCGHARAIVADLPGTTRDLLTATTLVRGWRLLLIDSAGQRATSDGLEAAGQALVAQARARADVVVFLRPAADAHAVAARPGDLVVTGKADLSRAAPDGAWWSAAGAHGRSAGELLAALGDAVLRRLGLPAEGG